MVGQSRRINSWIPIYLSIDTMVLFLFFTSFFLSFVKHTVFSSGNIDDAHARTHTHKGKDTCVKLGYFGVARIDLKLDGNSYEICSRRDHFISFRFSSTNRRIRTKYWMTGTHARCNFFFFFFFPSLRAGSFVTRARTHTHTRTNGGQNEIALFTQIRIRVSIRRRNWQIKPKPVKLKSFLWLDLSRIATLITFRPGKIRERGGGRGRGGWKNEHVLFTDKWKCTRYVDLS